MGIKAGLVGLPNVGKSTLFNALTKSSAPAENYPFCTIDPHVAITEVPDERLQKLQALYGSEKIIPGTVTFVDIAGLVKGAASGEGLGNQFLSHIREVDLILHVLRCFENDDITHTSNVIDPIADYEIIVAELILKDLESIEKRIERLPRLIKAAKAQEQKDLQQELDTLASLQTVLNRGDISAAQAILAETPLPSMPLLSTKNFLIAANIAEDDIETYENNPLFQAVIKQFGRDRVIPVCAKTEYELSQLGQEEALEMMAMLGLSEPSLHTIIKKTYDHLGLITFFTCGPREIHAWPLKKGTKIRPASGEIHSDLERGFICAEVFNYNDLAALGSIAKTKEAGKMRREGQDYIVNDGDIILVKFNV